MWNKWNLSRIAAPFIVFVSVNMPLVRHWHSLAIHVNDPYVLSGAMWGAGGGRRPHFYPGSEHVPHCCAKVRVKRPVVWLKHFNRREFFLSGSLPLIEFVICDVMCDMANKLLSLSLSLSLFLSVVLWLHLFALCTSFCSRDNYKFSFQCIIIIIIILLYFCTYFRLQITRRAEIQPRFCLLCHWIAGVPRFFLWLRQGPCFMQLTGEVVAMRGRRRLSNVIRWLIYWAAAMPCSHPALTCLPTTHLSVKTVSPSGWLVARSAV